MHQCHVDRRSHGFKRDQDPFDGLTLRRSSYDVFNLGKARPRFSLVLIVRLRVD